MAVTPAGCLALPLSYLRDQIAACDAFQELVDADDADEAKASIAYGYAPDEGDDLPMPRCIIRLADETDIAQVSTGSYNQTTSIAVTLEAVPPADDENIVTDGDVYIWWLNFVGALLVEVFDQRYNEGALNPDVNPSNIGTIDVRKENGVSFCVALLMFKNEGLP
jgi:hypothetical protein